MIKWKFPSNKDGQIKGVADAGIENFNGTELSSLAREICQNSLDAAINDENPDVVVEFERYFIPKKKIPGIYEYKQIVEKCKIFWDKSGSEKAKHFLKDAIYWLKYDDSYVLRVSDYNTTGLSDPYGNDNNSSGFNFDGWNALIKIDGGANKSDDKAGAFGIGKSAPFCNSQYRLVFYRTLNQAHERAAQGISRLMSYPEDVTKPMQTMTSGVGYYGDPNGNNPVESIPELDALSIRNEIGTDVFIYGFKGIDNHWETEIIVAILDNFLMSIYNGHLRVRLQGSEINATTLSNYIFRMHNQRPSDTKGTYGNYLALTRTEGVHTYIKDFHGMGSLKLKLLIDTNEKLDRKVLVVRKAGMKLFRLGNLSRLVPFTGILELNGKALNSYFREMETVAHDNWEPGRHKNPKQAKAFYEEIKDWIKAIITELAENTSDEEMDVEGLGGVLQREPETVIRGDSDNKRENLNDHLGQIKVLQNTSSAVVKGFFYGKGLDGNKNTEKTTGTLGSEGESGLRILKGKRKRKKMDLHKGKADINGKDIVIQKKPGGETNCALKNVRIIKQGIGSYLLNFEIPNSVAKARIEIVTVGENGKSNRIRIIGAKVISGCTSVHLDNDSLVATDLLSIDRVKIQVNLADSRDYAMEVNVYEHN